MKTFALLILIFVNWTALAQDEEAPRCATDNIQYNDGGFSDADFVGGGQGLLFGDSIAPDVGGAINTDLIVFPTDQPFVVDYLSEGAGANHLFGFFFMDIDTNKNGFPDFYETGDRDDLDGDGIVNADDDDIDGDGIPNTADNAAAAGVTNSADPSLFRNGAVAAAAGNFANDYWEFVPSNRISGKFEHPGAYLYVDENNNDVPDILEYGVGLNRIPPMALNKGYNTRHHIRNDNNFPGLLGRWFYSGTGASGDFHWIGSTIFKLADDDGDTNVGSPYSNYAPYGITDIYGNANARPDYDIYNTTNSASPLIPDEVKFVDPMGINAWRYRWFEGTVSGGREYAFFLVVFYGSGGSQVNTYYSKSGFNQDNPPATPNRNGATSGDNFGTWAGRTNWYPNYQNVGDHNLLAQAVFGLDWNQVVDVTQGLPPVAFDPANQAWVDKWENFTPSKRIVQYRGLSDWFSETPVDANTIINGRYGIDMSAEGDSGIVRAINGNMAHLMVGAPSADPEAWLLGWEDLYGGGDRDYEDVVFYVKREASGSAQSLNAATGLDRFEDVSITTVEFTFVDNFTDDLWGTEGTFINYAYRLASNQEWIYLLGGEHLRTPDVFDTTVDNGLVTRHAVIQLDQEGARELYWKVEMATADSDTFVPEVEVADVGYEALVHDIFFNSAVISSSNVDYFGALETPDFGWLEKGKNRGHMYAFNSFNHGVTLTENTISSSFDFLDSASSDPSVGEPFFWDAGIAMRDQLNRRIYTFVDAFGSLVRQDFAPGLAPPVINALELSDDIVDGVMADNFHNPASSTLEPVPASDWLVQWVYGYHGAISDGVTTIPGYPREWKLGGINRSTVAVVRSPGIPTWLTGTGVPIEIKQDYSDWVQEPAQLNTPTRVLVGSEAGMLHALNAGTWVGRRCDPIHTYADGCYTDYGTGEEVWGMIPNNLLEDIKYNKTGKKSVSAKIDATPIVAVVREGTEWRRVAVVAQGENGGSENGRVGNVVWAIDISQVDNPRPLWEFTDPTMGNIIHPLAIAWAELAGGPEWIVAMNSGITPSPTNRATMYYLNAYSGALLDRTDVGTFGSSMGGAPALIDSDQNGYVDWSYSATSDGLLVAQSLKDFNLVQTLSVPGARFFLTPNVAPLPERKTLVVAVSGDSPLVDDEGGEPNRLVAYIHDTDPAAVQTWTYLGDFQLPDGHKAFARPRLVGSSLVLATTTGETFSFCDPDPDDPGNLYLFRDVFRLDDIDPADPDNTGLQAALGFGSVRAPITVTNGVINAHSSIRGEGGFSIKGKAKRPPETTAQLGNVFGVVGWTEPFLDGSL